MGTLLYHIPLSNSRCRIFVLFHSLEPVSLEKCGLTHAVHFPPVLTSFPTFRSPQYNRSDYRKSLVSRLGTTREAGAFLKPNGPAGRTKSLRRRQFRPLLTFMLTFLDSVVSHCFFPFYSISIFPPRDRSSGASERLIYVDSV
jgi:hypothetical protein